MTFSVTLVSILLVVNVILRTFTNGFNILPKVLNLADLPIVGVLFFHFLLRPSQFLLPPWIRGIRYKATAMLMVLAAGTLLNLEYFFPNAAISQALMLLAPLALFFAIFQIPYSKQQILLYIRLFRRLLVFEVVVGVLQVPARLASGESEEIHGTFPGNAEQYAAFILIGVFYLAGDLAINRHRRTKSLLMILSVIGLIISIDNKASWLGIVVAGGFILSQLGSFDSIVARTWILALSFGIFAGALVFVSSSVSTTFYKFEILADVLKNGDLASLGKIKAYVDIWRSHSTHPHMFLVGAGPANLYSRGCRQFFLSETARLKMYSNPDFLKPERSQSGDSAASDSTGGVVAVSRVTPYYSQFYGEQNAIFAIGSHQVDTPYSPYAGLLGETGIVGAWLYISIYATVFFRLTKLSRDLRSHPEIFQFSIATLGLLVYLITNSIYGPFLETTRMTTILWSMIGLIFVYARVCEHDPIPVTE